MTEVRPDPLLEGLFFTARSHSINETEPPPVPEEDETKQSDEVSHKLLRAQNTFISLSLSFALFILSFH